MRCSTTLSITPDNPYKVEVSDEKWDDGQDGSAVGDLANNDHELNRRVRQDAINGGHGLIAEDSSSESSSYHYNSCDCCDCYDCTLEECCPQDLSESSVYQKGFMLFLFLVILVGCIMVITVETKFKKSAFLIDGYEMINVIDVSGSNISAAVFLIILMIFIILAYMRDSPCCKFIMQFTALGISFMLFIGTCVNAYNLNPNKCNKYIGMYMKDLLSFYNSTEERVIQFKEHYNVTNEYMLYDAVREYVTYTCGKHVKLRYATIGLLLSVVYTIISGSLLQVLLIIGGIF